MEAAPAIYGLKNTEIIAELLSMRRVNGKRFYLCRQVTPRVHHGVVYLYYSEKRWELLGNLASRSEDTLGLVSKVIKPTEVDAHRLEKQAAETDMTHVPVSAYYGPEWRRLRAIILTRDNYICQRCGATERTCGKRLHVHHIIPKQYAPSILAANHPDNLITLCYFCHPIVQSQDHTDRHSIRKLDRRQAKEAMDRPQLEG